MIIILAFIFTIINILTAAPPQCICLPCYNHPCIMDVACCPSYKTTLPPIVSPQYKEIKPNVEVLHVSRNAKEPTYTYSKMFIEPIFKPMHIPVHVNCTNIQDHQEIRKNYNSTAATVAAKLLYNIPVNEYMHINISDHTKINSNDTSSDIPYYSVDIYIKMTIFVIIPMVTIAGAGFIFITYKFKQHVKSVEESTQRLINIEIERNNEQHFSFGRSRYHSNVNDDASRNPFTNPNEVNRNAAIRTNQHNNNGNSV